MMTKLEFIIFLIVFGLLIVGLVIAIYNHFKFQKELKDIKDDIDSSTS